MRWWRLDFGTQRIARTMRKTYGERKEDRGMINNNSNLSINLTLNTK